MDPVEAAALIAFRVARAQGFAEGHKRTALLQARWTLDNNGLDGHRIIEPDDRELADLLGHAASGRLAYDAARKSVTGALLMSGHRVLSRPGSHQALAQYADALAMQVDEPALNRFDRIRRNRNRSEYGSRTFGKAEVKEAIDTARAIRAACASPI